MRYAMHQPPQIPARTQRKLLLRRRVLSTIVMLAVLASLSVSARAQDKLNRKAEIHEIQQLDEQWRAALVAGDTATLNRLLADDFLGITANGKLWSKREFIDRIANHQQQFQQVEMVESNFRVRRSSAVVIARAHVRETTGGNPIDGYFRYTVVYGRKGGGPWQMLNFEATRVSGGAEGEPAPGKPSSPPSSPQP